MLAKERNQTHAMGGEEVTKNEMTNRERSWNSEKRKRLQE